MNPLSRTSSESAVCLWSAVYEGDYSQGKIHGFGVIKFPDQRRFEGQFRDNKKNGKGKYEGANGIYEGDYGELTREM